MGGVRLRSTAIRFLKILIWMVFLTTGFARETAEKRLELKSRKGQTKAAELGPRWRELLSLRLALKAI